jgi:hypothetical protein
MKTVFFAALFFSFYVVSAQNINITSFQHSIRWLDEGSFPPYVKSDSVKDALLNAAASGLSNHFNSIVVTKPSTVEYKNIKMFGKPVIKEPAASSRAGDFQVSLFSFLTRATTGMDVFWMMEIIVHRDRKEVYKHAIKHQLKNYNSSYSWFTEDEFIDLFALLLNELFENREALDPVIVLGTKPANNDSILRANCERWKVDKNKELLGFGKPAFGPYQTMEAGQTDSAAILKKSKAGKETSVEISKGKTWFDQSKVIDKNITKFCSLVLNSSTDTAFVFFSIMTASRKQKQTALGFIFSGNNDNKSSTLFYDRNLIGEISTGIDSVHWNFSLDHYVNGEITGGALINEQDSFKLFSTSLEGLKKEIVVADKNGAYLAALVAGLSTTEIFLRKDLSSSSRQAIAALFAVLTSIKNLPE